MSVSDGTLEQRIALLNDMLQGSLSCDDDSIRMSLVSREGLMDVLLALYDECCHYKLMNNKHVAAFVKKYRSTVDEIRRLRLQVEDFEVKNVIGRGHFGEVMVVRDKHTETVYAMKTLRKQETLAQSEISFFEEERDIMATANSPWITKLHYAFQDAHTLYLIMDFYAGGDLLSLLSRHDDIFEEKMARFYLAEIVLATHDLHKMGYVHRDLKPENVLLDSTGHVKLADFGSAAKLNEDGLVSSKMPVGTPDYVSPELLDAMNSDVVNLYGIEVDWWSLGVCMYEMLCGRTPFTDETGSMVATYSNIMNYKNCLKFPEGLSHESCQLMKSLLTDKEHRLVYTGIVKHNFFNDITWDNLRKEKPPFVPQLSSLDDTSNFEEFEKIKHAHFFDGPKDDGGFSGNDLPFVGFTYTKSVKEKPKSVSEECDIEVTTDKRRNSTSVDVTLTVRLAEMKRLRERCHKLAESECDLKTRVEQLEHGLLEKEEDLTKMSIENKSYQRDLENYIAKTCRLSKQVETLVAEQAKAEMELCKISDMSSEAKQIQEELHDMQLAELQEVISLLEEEKGALAKKVTERDGDILKLKDQLETSLRHANHLQAKIDKDRRKSRSDQKRDLALLENREEIWQTKLENKNAEILELNKRIEELEGLAEAQESQEKEYMAREQELREKLKGVEQQLQERSQDIPHRDNLDIRVHVHTGSPSPKKDRRMSERMKEIEEKFQSHEKEREAWEQQEEQFRDTIEKLKAELEKKKVRDQTKTDLNESLTSQVHVYQQEVTEMRSRIKDLQESVRNVTSESNDDKTRKLSRLEKKIKELEAQIDDLRDDKRRLLSEVTTLKQQHSEKDFQITELERTTSRQSCKIERLEKQLQHTRDRELDMRLKRNQTSDIRIKLAEDRVSDIEAEKIKLETKIKELNATVTDLESKQSKVETEIQAASSKVLSENLDLKSKLEEMTRTVEKLEKQITKCEQNMACLEEEVKSKNSELSSLRVVRVEKSSLERKITNLEDEIKRKDRMIERGLEKETSLSKLEREKENLESKVASLEKEMSELKSKEKSTLVRRASNLESVEDLKQEKRYLESRVSTLQRQLEAMDKKVLDLEAEKVNLASTSARVQDLEKDVERLKQDKCRLQDELRDERADMERKSRLQSSQRGNVQHVEEKLEEERQRHDSLLAEIRGELSKSNLALSEARSLLSATQRQEKNTRAMLEADIRELQQRIFLLEKEKGMNEDKWKSENAESARAALSGEMKELTTENENLARKVKELEAQLGGAQREKSASLMEKHLLKENMAQAEQKCQIETQKVEKLRGICAELENQIKDLEGLQQQYDDKEAAWEAERAEYQRTIADREAQVQGTSNKLNALSQSRQTSHEMAQTVKQQLQAAKEKHRADIDHLRTQLADTKKHASKNDSLFAEMESQNSKLQMIVEQQTTLLEHNTSEVRRLKEEISKMLTENQQVRTKNIKLQQNLEEAVDKLELIFGEKIDLENFTEALQGLHFLEKYRFESTIGQQMKLIDYLQDLWQDSQAKKKKTPVNDGSMSKHSKLFAKGKDGMATLPVMGDLQSALDQECKRSRQLQEQVNRLRQDNFAQANELLKVKSNLRELTLNGTQHITSSVQVRIMQTPSKGSGSDAPVSLLTPSIKKSSQMLPPSTPTTRMQHKIPHRFVNGLNTRATKCGVCLGSVPFVKQAAKCQECSMVCHQKCVSSAPASCGLPTEYAQHISSIMEHRGYLSHAGHANSARDDKIQMKGWLKIPKLGKQHGWERRWCMMEDNILMLFNNDCDANPTDTFDLNPPQTDVTVHSSVSKAELPSTASTDLQYVFRLEHEPLTTCWPGRVLYLMAPDFSEKQRWVACLEVAVKNLQSEDKTKRYKIDVTPLLELEADRRLELNCSLLLSKQLTILGADEGLFAVNVHRDPPVLTKLNQFDSVHQIKYIPQLTLLILVTGKNRKVLTIDKKMIQLRLGQSSGEETQPVPHTVVDSVVGCTVLEAGQSGDEVYMCVGMIDRLLIMKYNSDLRTFCVRKSLTVYEPCSCVCMAENFFIVGADRFYKINVEHPSLTEFVDKKDNSLAFAAFGAVTHHSYPLAVVKVSPEGLPLEFLICFHEFGVYVDRQGRRSRPADMKWSCLPLSVAYREPFLYVTYFNSVQAITVPASKDEIRGKQTSADLSCPRYLGAALELGSVYVASSSGVTSQLMCLRGNDGTIIEPIGKENRGSSLKSNGSQSSGYSSQKFVSPKKMGADKYRSSGRRRRVSLTSLDSNSSVSSSSTVSSYKSVQSDV